MARYRMHVLVLMKGKNIEEEFFLGQRSDESENYIVEQFSGMIGDKFKPYIFDAMYYGKENCVDGFTLLHHCWRID